MLGEAPLLLPFAIRSLASLVIFGQAHSRCFRSPQPQHSTGCLRGIMLGLSELKELFLHSLPLASGFVGAFVKVEVVAFLRRSCSSATFLRSASFVCSNYSFSVISLDLFVVLSFFSVRIRWISFVHTSSCKAIRSAESRSFGDRSRIFSASSSSLDEVSKSTDGFGFFFIRLLGLATGCSVSDELLLLITRRFGCRITVDDRRSCFVFCLRRHLLRYSVSSDCWVFSERARFGLVDVRSASRIR